MKKLIFIKIFISIALTSSITPKQIDIIFNIVQDPNTLASVQIEVTGAGQNPDAQTEF